MTLLVSAMDLWDGLAFCEATEGRSPEARRRQPMSPHAHTIFTFTTTSET